MFNFFKKKLEPVLVTPKYIDYEETHNVGKITYQIKLINDDTYTKTFSGSVEANFGPNYETYAYCWYAKDFSPIVYSTMDCGTYVNTNHIVSAKVINTQDYNVTVKLRKLDK